MDPRAYRLPGTLRPRRYDVELDARVDRPTFTGRVRIEMDVLEPVEALELHARDLDVTDARLVREGKETVLTTQVHADAEMLRLLAPRLVEPGPATLLLGFSGKVSRSMEGLYLSQDGPERCLATQCEETDARAIFPCFDEPEYKARFAWNVATTPDVTVLANGPLEEMQDRADGSRVWRFAPTKPMSSYLAALCIGHFDSTPVRVERNVPLKVWALHGKGGQGLFARDFTAALLPWFEDYFAKPYHFDKYDQIAVPSFSAGAMENSGLVIFRKSLLLHDAKTTSWHNEKLIARVVAHEFAHQWFGNLVTMRWWDDIWLNESFAEWIAHKAVDAVAPEYGVWEDFQEGKATALASDALESTHPVYTKVETPAQATELFDAITYEKGSSVLRMLEGFLGEEAFRSGLRTYMEAFAESNAEGRDLWTHLERASGRPVQDIMASWLLQPGHPLVAVTLKDEGARSVRLHVRQSRFLSKAGAPESPQTWRVPLVLRYEDDAGIHEARRLLEAREATLDLPVSGALRWVDVNAGGIGFYRAQPDDVLLRRQVGAFERLAPAEQVGLLDDQWGLVRNGTQSIERFLETLDAAMRRAQHHSVLARVAVRLGRLEDILEEAGNAAALASYREWIASRLRGQAEALGIAPREGEARNDRERRLHLLRALAKLAHDEDAIGRARAIAEREAGAPAAVDADLAGPAVAIAARFGDEARFEEHVAIYERRRASSASPEEVQRYLGSLPQFPQPALVERTLRMMEDGTLPLEAVGPLLRSMLGLRHAREHAWRFVRANWPLVRERLGDMWTGSIVEASGGLPPALRDDMVRFYDANLHGVAQQAYARALETVDQRAQLQARVEDALVEWFARRAWR